jgi:hypothetical protein
MKYYLSKNAKFDKTYQKIISRFYREINKRDATRIGSDLRSSQGDVIILIESFIVRQESDIMF